jgi:hypothetical protein
MVLKNWSGKNIVSRVPLRGSSKNMYLFVQGKRNRERKKEK